MSINSYLGIVFLVMSSNIKAYSQPIQPIFSLQECSKLFKIDSLLKHKEFDSAIVNINTLRFSNSILKNDSHLFLKLFTCYKDKNLDSSFTFLEMAISYGLHCIDSVCDLPESFLLFSKEKNEVLQSEFQQNLLPSKRNDSLLRLVNNLIAYDQLARGNVGYADSFLTVKHDSLANQIRVVDSYNLSIIRPLIYRYGWLGYSTLGEHGDIHLWALVQHADQDVGFQKFVLKLIESQVLLHNTRKENYAYLYDRVCVNQNLPQVFGTQLKYADSTKFELQPLQDEQNVDYYRHAFNLPPLRYYLEDFKRRVGYKQ